jgi:uncharacterized ParB-like nuclease family protein
LKVRYGWVKIDGIKGKLIRNPAYPGPKVGLNGWVSTDRIGTKDKPEFQLALTESIAKEGVRNPIIVYALESGDYLGFGGSRLNAARDAGLERIPALINDHCNRYRYLREITPENWQDVFTDIPRYFEFTEDGVDYHYSLEKNRRMHFDPAGIVWRKGEPLSEFSWIKSWEG